jgi:hypothetical protein
MTAQRFTATVSRRDFLAGAAACTALPRAFGSAPPRRPNFIIFYTDDQGIGDLGAYGARDVKTPHLDALAASGARFTN